MSAVLIGLALALSASLAQAAGYLCQHLNAAERPPVSARRPLRTLSSMLRSPWWRVGLLLGATGFVLHLSALALAPISLVQAFVAGGLALVAPPPAARAFHHHLTRAERRAVPLMAASLAALALGISDPTRHLHFDGSELGLYLAVRPCSWPPSCHSRRGTIPSPCPRAGGRALLRRPGQLHQGAGRPVPLGRPGRRDPFAPSARRRGGGGDGVLLLPARLQTNRP